MVSPPCFLKITLVTFLAVMCSGGHPNARSTEQSPELTSQPTWAEVEEAQRPSRQGVPTPFFRRRRPTQARMGAGCRRRMACEAARTMTHVFPLSDYWQETVRLGPEPNSAYFAAWYKGLLNKDCSEFYPDCSNSPTGMVLPLLTDVLGPKGFVGSFLERLAIPSSPQVPRDAGAPRTSLVMQRLREAQRRWESKEARISSEEIASRRA